MTEELKESLEAEVQRHDGDIGDISRVYYKRYHIELDCHDPNWTESAVDYLEQVDEYWKDKVIAYGPRRIYIRDNDGLGFVSAPRHFQNLDVGDEVMG